MVRIRVTREHLARILRSYGEDAHGERALALSSDDLDRLGEIAGDYATGQRLVPPGTKPPPQKRGMLLDKATALAAVEVIEGGPRALAREIRRLKGIYPGH